MDEDWFSAAHRVGFRDMVFELSGMNTCPRMMSGFLAQTQVPQHQQQQLNPHRCTKKSLDILKY